jgi:hypothetical protein
MNEQTKTINMKEDFYQALRRAKAINTGTALKLKLSNHRKEIDLKFEEMKRKYSVN